MVGQDNEPEILFELLVGFERFPHPPLGVLVRMQVGAGSGVHSGG